MRRFGAKGFKPAIIKTAADQLLFSPPGLVVFFTFLGLMQGHSFAEIGQKIKQDYWPTMFGASHLYRNALCTQLYYTRTYTKTRWADITYSELGGVAHRAAVQLRRVAAQRPRAVRLLRRHRVVRAPPCPADRD